MPANDPRAFVGVSDRCSVLLPLVVVVVVVVVVRVSVLYIVSLLPQITQTNTLFRDDPNCRPFELEKRAVFFKQQQTAKILSTGQVKE